MVDAERPKWPMIVLRTPKGWTGPKGSDDGQKIEGSFRAHQVPISMEKSGRTLGTVETTGCAATIRKSCFDEKGSV